MQDYDRPVLEHLAELRRRLIIIIVSVVISMVFIYWKAPLIIEFVKRPIDNFKLDLAFFDMTEAFVIRIKLSLIGSIIIMSPLILFEILAFIRPGLKDNEWKLLYKALFFLLGAFVSGIIFTYIFIVPRTLSFLIIFGKSYMQPVLSAERYLGFISMFCLVSGITFTIPVILCVIGKLGILDYKLLKKGRKYVYIVLITFEGIMVPLSDFFTFLFIAMPIVFLYELSILIMYFTEKRRKIY